MNKKINHEVKIVIILHVHIMVLGKTSELASLEGLIDSVNCLYVIAVHSAIACSCMNLVHLKSKVNEHSKAPVDKKGLI